jgi:hypothetical protein
MSSRGVSSSAATSTDRSFTVREIDAITFFCRLKASYGGVMLISSHPGALMHAIVKEDHPRKDGPRQSQ